MTKPETKSKIDWDAVHARQEHPEDFVGAAFAAEHPDAPWNIFREIVQSCGINIEKVKGMTLLSAISEAAELKEAFDRLQAADGNLSIKGALAECKRLGGTDKESDKVLAEIEADTADGRLLKSTFNRLAVCVRSFNRTSILRPERMGSYLADGAEALAKLQIGRASMMLAVVRKLTATEKDLWGTQDSPTSHAAAISKAKEALEAAYRKIDQAVALSDLTSHATVSQDREEGKSILTFKITGDLIRLGDGRDVGERLVSWWQQNDGRKRGVAA